MAQGGTAEARLGAGLDPRLLRTFLAVCRENSISGAARLLGVSQPSVSVAIAQLEQRLGTTLFERSRQGIVLSSEGQALEQHAEMLDHLLRDAQQSVALASRGVRGPLRIGGTPGALVSLVPDAIARMEESGSRFSLQIVENPDGELADLLRSGEIEVALATTTLDAPPEDIVERSIARDPFALIVGRAHDRLGPSVSLREITNFGWVLPRAAGAFHRQIDALFMAAQVSAPTDVIRCDSLLTSKAIVRAGRRVTVLPRGVVAAELAHGELRALPITDIEIIRTIGVRTLAGRRLSPLAAAFIEGVVASNP
jgi:DNA-binding transcriptional LysR family regulator